MEKVKKILIVIAIITATWLIGYVIGRNHFRDTTKKVQIDTTFVYDTLKYSRLQLLRNTYKLDIPDRKRPSSLRFVFIPIEKTDTIIKEEKVYIAMEREYRYTETEDVQIWHSGVDSTIDSLNVFVRNMVISKTETTTEMLPPWGYSVSLSLSYGRMGKSYIEPVIAAEVSYKRIAVNAQAGVNIEIENMTINRPSFCWQVGMKYNLFGR